MKKIQRHYIREKNIYQHIEQELKQQDPKYRTRNKRRTEDNVLFPDHRSGPLLSLDILQIGRKIKQIVLFCRATQEDGRRNEPKNEVAEGNLPFWSEISEVPQMFWASFLNVSN